MTTKNKSLMIGDLVIVKHVNNAIGIIVGEEVIVMSDTKFGIQFWKIYWIHCGGGADKDGISGFGLYPKEQLTRDIKTIS